MNFEDQQNESPPAVVAAVSAYVNDETISQCYQVGMVEVFSKPLDSKQLAGFINKYHKRM